MNSRIYKEFCREFLPGSWLSLIVVQSVYFLYVLFFFCSLLFVCQSTHGTRKTKEHRKMRRKRTNWHNIKENKKEGTEKNADINFEEEHKIIYPAFPASFFAFLLPLSLFLFFSLAPPLLLSLDWFLAASSISVFALLFWSSIIWWCVFGFSFSSDRKVATKRCELSLKETQSRTEKQLFKNVPFHLLIWEFDGTYKERTRDLAKRKYGSKVWRIPDCFLKRCISSSSSNRGVNMISPCGLTDR